MNTTELIKVINFIKEMFPNEEFLVSCNDGWDWSIGNQDYVFYWDRDHQNTFETIKKEILEQIKENYLDKDI